MMDVAGWGRLLVTFGVVLIIVVALLVAAGKVPLLGRLPGDLVFRKDGLTVFAPIATMLILSVVLTIVANLFFRIFR